MATSRSSDYKTVLMPISICYYIFKGKVKCRPYVFLLVIIVLNRWLLHCNLKVWCRGDEQIRRFRSAPGQPEVNRTCGLLPSMLRVQFFYFRLLLSVLSCNQAKKWKSPVFKITKRPKLVVTQSEEMGTTWTIDH